jgi:hypothetical protein
VVSKGGRYISFPAQGGRRQWLVERRRIGPVIRELERFVDPLFRQR